MNSVKLNSVSKIYGFIFLLLVASAFSACYKQVAFHAYRSLPVQGWLIADTVFFDVMCTDTLVACPLEVGIRYRDDYPYRNIALEMGILSATTGQRLSVEQVSMYVEDEVGNRSGIGWGGLRSILHAVRPLRVDSVATYRIYIRHTMADSCLTGINDVGIRLNHP